MTKPRLARAGALLAAGILASCAALAPSPPPTLLFYNARVHTVDDAQPSAEAVAVAGDRIVAVGSNAAVRALAGAGTRSIDLGGQMLLPGFNDAHTHFGNAIEWYFQVMLMHVEDPAAMLRGLREATARVPKGMWITGGDWGTVAAGRAARQGREGLVAFAPDLKAIDAVSPDHPVLFRRHDRSYFINSAGMRALRFDTAVSDPATGRYGRDASGEFTGMLFGTVGELIEKQLPPMSHAQALVGARGVARDLNRVGITSIQDMARVDEISRQQLYHAHIERSFTDLRVFQDLRDRRELTMRVYAIFPLRQWAGLGAAGIRPRTGDAWLSYGALKDLADNGYMLEPYADNPRYRGGWTFRMVDEAFEERQMVDADRAGFDMTTHVIGDLALRRTLDWYEAAIRANGPRADRRQRIIHVWYAHPDDLARAGRLGLAADVQPAALLERYEAVARSLGPEREKWASAYRTMIDNGVRLLLSSDFPGTVNRLSLAVYHPLENIYLAVTRQDLHGQPAGGFHPEQRISVDEAIRAYTINPAWASHEEKLKGSITVGKLADLVVLSKDIRGIPPRELLKTEVRYTVVGGRIVHGD
jgi:predicted amidohydrolase YtcJ